MPEPAGPRRTGAIAPGSSRAEDLLDAASRRFIAVGVSKTTMEDIAREAGAGKATLYRTFRNKDAVVDALVGRENQRFERTLRRAVDEADTAAGKAEGAFVAALDFLCSHPMLTKSLDEEPEVLLPYLTLQSGPIAQSVMALFRQVVSDGIASGEFRQVNVDWAAETLLRLIMSFFTLPQLGIRIDDPEAVRRYARGLVAGGLVADGSAHR